MLESNPKSVAVDSSLLSAGAPAFSTVDLISQIIKAVQEPTTDAEERYFSRRTSLGASCLLEENAVDVNAFEQSLNMEIGYTGSFVDFLARKIVAPR